MPTFRVGSLYNPIRTTWPESAQYSYRAGTHELVAFYVEPSVREVKAFETGPCEFALCVRESALWLLSRFGDLPWSDHPYSWHLVPEHERDLPSADLEAGRRALCQVLLVDATTGILRAIRLVSWSPEFTRAMHAAIRAQASTPWDARAFDATIARAYDELDTVAMVREATAHCVGGAE